MLKTVTALKAEDETVPDLSTMFVSGEYSRVRRPGTGGNKLYLKNDYAIGIVVVKLSRSGSDYALNVEALKYVVDAVEAGRLPNAYIVGVGHEGEYQCQIDAMKVSSALKDVRPLTGELGSDYWWLGPNLWPVSVPDLSAPF